MNLRAWAHTALHVGCIALVLLQGHRIFELQQQKRQRQDRIGRVVEMFSRCMDKLPMADRPFVFHGFLPIQDVPGVAPKQ
jgi:hypothetical protein